MYNTKKEVDAHVRASLSKLRSETERQFRGFTVAKLYYRINEYALAEQYLCSYLAVKEDNDQAHKMLGQCYERLKKPDKALQSYQRSLQLNPKQPGLLADICQMLLDDKNVNTNKASYWCDLAESEKVKHDAVISLRLKLLNKDNVETNQVEDFLQKEISAKPNDVSLRVRLVRKYIEQNKLLAAFNYVQTLEMSNNDAFTSSGEWYNVVWLLLSKYEQMPNIKKDWDLWVLVASCLERQVSISFASIYCGGDATTSSATETANLLFLFDQYLFKITQLAGKLSAPAELVAIFLDHYRGQLLLHTLALIFKRELVQNRNQWRGTVKIALPLLLLAFQVKPPITNENWMKHCDEHGKKLIQIWQREGAFRCSQVGRILLSCIADESIDKDTNDSALQMKSLLNSVPSVWSSIDELLAQIRQTCSDKSWRHNVFALIFCNSDQKMKEQHSLLIKSPLLAEPVYELPSYADVENYEDYAQYLRPQSLSHMVYLCLSHENLSYARAKFFGSLNFSTQNLSYCGAESLNQLDVDTFLYAATIQAKRMLQVERETFNNYNEGNFSASGRPSILPFALLEQQLCTDEQAVWWHSAYQIYKGLSADNLAELRANLQNGIEAVRGINGPKIDMVIVFKLGQILVARAQDVVKPMEKTFLEARAESIYKYGLGMLKMSHKGVLEPYRKYFRYAKADTAAVGREITAAAENAVSYLAMRYFKKSEYEELIEELTGLQVPFATYLQAEAYRKLDEASKTPIKAKRMYLDRASECLNQTIALLKNTQTDPNHPLNSIIHNEVRRLQQSSRRHLNDSCATLTYSPIAHNNSSTYEDAEADFNADTSIGTNAVSRSRRETAAALITSAHNSELENLVKQMASMLSSIKVEIVENIKPEVLSMRKEMTSLKDQIVQLEDAMKKTRISTSNPPSRDDASHVLDDLYMIEDALQNQLYPQQPTSQTHLLSQQQQQQQRIHTPNTMQIQQNAAAVAAVAAYNPIFNPNYPLGYYSPPYMMAQGPQGVAGQGPMMCQRNSVAMPYMDSGAMNFNLPNNSLLPQPNAQDGRSSNLYGLLAQQSNAAMSTIPQPITMPAAPPSSSAPSVQFNKALNSQPVEKGPPANVVITSSDPLPNPNIASLQTTQPTLSVTIPSHHIKSSIVQTPEAVAPPVFTGSMFGMNTSLSLSGTFTGFSTNSNPISTSLSLSTSNNKSITSNISTNFSTSSTMPFSFKPQVAQAKQSNAAANDSSLQQIVDSFSSDQNKSGGTDSEIEYDPRPDFKPIIALPDEIVVKTGEEDEEIMFCHRAKLFRNIDKEWKERGIGDIKILKGKDGSSRILMRRDQTHKICANHKITKDMTLTQSNEQKGHIWVADDFADQELKREKFFVRFKEAETVLEFQKAFVQAQQEALKLDAQQKMQPPKFAGKIIPPTKPSPNSQPPFGLAKSATSSFVTSTPVTKPESTGLLAKPVNLKPTATSTSVTSTSVSKPLFSGFSVPKTAQDENKSQNVQIAPFANFSFDKLSAATSANPVASPFANIFSNVGSPMQSSIGQLSTSAQTAVATSDTTLNKSDAEDDYVPTAQFKPVIPLPDLVEVSTGEENEIVLFEHRAKLLRFDKDTSEWKERGLGNIKLLQDKDDASKVRIVMRREQIHKLCCNQRLNKDTSFKYAKNSSTALSWAGQDFSENNLITEMLTVRFKTPDVCTQFHEAVLKAQANMSSDTAEGKVPPDEAVSQDTPKGFGDAFKPKAGSWSCNDCYTSNTAESLYCASCDAPKDDTVPKKAPTSILSNTSANTFSFGFGAKDNAPKPAFSFGITPAAPSSTQISGFGEQFKPKTGSWSCKSCYLLNTADLDYCSACELPRDSVVTPAFTFGAAPLTTPSTKKSDESTAKPSNTSGFGEQFKPKAGAWSCESCYLSNNADVDYCSACDCPKDDTVAKKEGNNILNLSNSAPKFSFGFPPANATEPPKVSPFSGANFGQLTATSTVPAFGTIEKSGGDVSKSFSFPPPTTTSTASLGKPTFTFTLQSKAMDSPTMPTAAAGSGFSFNMKSKSPLKACGGGDADVALAEADDADYQEEENSTYFTPVIPLPDKIDVKTGEEDEDVLYVHRAKLFRYTDGEWKERGLGDLKILRHKATKKLRIVMRREQILKICLNHALNAELEYKRKDDKSWLFVVHDFSEGEVELQKFSLRFKSKEVAQAFFDAVNSALSNNTDVTTIVSTTANISTNGTLSKTDALTVEGAQGLKEDLSNAKTSCTGCRGCDSESFVFPTLKTGEHFVHVDDTVDPLIPYEMSSYKLPKSSNRYKTDLLKQSALSPAKAVTPTQDPLKEKSSNLFTNFGGANSTLFNSVDVDKPSNVKFSFAAAFDASNKPNDSKTESTGFFFGNSGGPFLDKKPVFGQSPFFGKAPTSLNNPKPLNEAAVNISTGSLFGGTAFSTTSFNLGGADENKNEASANGSGKFIFGTSSNITKNDGNKIAFGTQPTLSFGENKNITNNPILFGETSKENKSPDSTTNVTPFAGLPNKADSIDFASLAAKANSDTAVIKTSSPADFIGLTNQNAFSSFLQPNNNNKSLSTPKSSNVKSNDSLNKTLENADGGADDNENNYDPHFEPIIALPDEIVVKTGEEEETKLFGERAMLFRYDSKNKEWKERGVGEIKILLHPEHQTYRLLMRREQIYKLVLNHAIGAEFTFNNLNKNPKSFSWAAINYAESNAGELENLAVRFKKVELADQFKHLLEECIEMAKKRSTQAKD